MRIRCSRTWAITCMLVAGCSDASPVGAGGDAGDVDPATADGRTGDTPVAEIPPDSAGDSAVGDSARERESTDGVLVDGPGVDDSAGDSGNTDGVLVDGPGVDDSAGGVDDSAGGVDDSAGGVDDSAGDVDDSAGDVDDSAGDVDDSAGEGGHSDGALSDGPGPESLEDADALLSDGGAEAGAEDAAFDFGSEQAEGDMAGVDVSGGDEVTIHDTTPDEGGGQVVPPEWLCMPCWTDADCSADPSANLCVKYDGGSSFCGFACENDASCPQDYLCLPVADGQGGTIQQCVLSAGECGCALSWVEKGASTGCVLSNQFGSCSGKRVCKADGLTTCDAATPALEECNGLDDDCDGLFDGQGAWGCSNFYVDKDMDGYGAAGDAGVCLCAKDSQHTASNNKDCNDSSFVIKPGMPEKCDNIDNDCDGKVDPDGTPGCSVWFKDEDADGYGDANSAPMCLCVSTEIYDALNALDCDDAQYMVKPGMTEKCDGLDNNCDGDADPPGSLDCLSYYKDKDGDGWGDLLSPPNCQCGPTQQYPVSNKEDCNDGSAAVPSCAGKDCGEDGCGKSCGLCTGSFVCDVSTCTPEVMVREAGTCPVGYTQAGSWQTGPGAEDGAPEGQGYGQPPCDTAQMALCALDPLKYKVVVYQDECDDPHSYLGCQPGFIGQGRWHVGQWKADGNYCTKQSGTGFDNGKVKAGWMELCVKSTVSSAKAATVADECAATQAECPPGWTEAGRWKPAFSKCDASAEAICANGTIDSGWVALCVGK